LKREIDEEKETILGFDTEMIDSRITPYNYCIDTTGCKFMPVVMIQLCTRRNVYIFHNIYLYKNRYIHPVLAKILRSENVIKVGFATHNDSEGLYKTLGVGTANVIDLKSISRLFRLPLSSLKDVSRWCTTYTLNKEDAHDWSRSLRGKERTNSIEYAALDAIVCLEAYEYIRKLYKIDFDDETDVIGWLECRCKKDEKKEVLVAILSTEYLPWAQKYFLEQRKTKALELVDKLKK